MENSESVIIAVLSTLILIFFLLMAYKLGNDDTHSEICHKLYILNINDPILLDYCGNKFK